MPDTPLLTDPLLYNELVNEMEPPEQFEGIALVGTPEDYPFPTFAGEIEYSTRQVAGMNAPNAEAQIVSMLGFGEFSGKFMYARLKKVFEGTLLKWLRTPGDFARQKADAIITKETADLTLRIDRLKEFIIWKILTTGTLTFTVGGVDIVLNWQMPGGHKPTAGTPWNEDVDGPIIGDTDADGYFDADIITDLKVWRQLSLDASNVTPDEIWINSLSLDVLYKNRYLKDLWTDRMKEELINKGYLSGVLGFKWKTYDLTYQDHTGASQAYIPEGKLLMFNRSGLIEAYNGPSPDTEAPDNTYGRFGKAWHSKDPSGYTGLVEDTFMFHLKRPKQIVCATIYTPA